MIQAERKKHKSGIETFEAADFVVSSPIEASHPEQNQGRLQRSVNYRARLLNSCLCVLLWFLTRTLLRNQVI